MKEINYSIIKNQNQLHYLSVISYNNVIRQRHFSYSVHLICLQAFINTAKEIYQKIQDGVFDINNEVCFDLHCNFFFRACVLFVMRLYSW